MHIEEQQKKYLPLTGGFGFWTFPESWSRFLQPFWRYLALPAQFIILAFAVAGVVGIWLHGYQRDLSGWQHIILLAYLVRRPDAVGDWLFMATLMVCAPATLAVQTWLKPADLTLKDFVWQNGGVMFYCILMATFTVLIVLRALRRRPTSESIEGGDIKSR